MATHTTESLERLDKVVHAIGDEAGACFQDNEDRMVYVRRLRRAVELLSGTADEMETDYKRLHG